MPDQNIFEELEEVWLLLDKLIRTQPKEVRINFVNNKRTFLKDVATSIQAYKDLGKHTAIEYHRDVHNELRALWHMAHNEKSCIEVIRKRLLTVSPIAREYISQRASHVLPRLFPKDSGTGDFWKWSRQAPGVKLLRAVAVLTAEGGIEVEGRSRGPNKNRSRSRLEPRIMGLARGEKPDKDGHARKMNRRIEGGRPRVIDRRAMLISWLAIDWQKSTGSLPTQGRSEKTPFGSLVHNVFDIAGLKENEAEDSLRVYWQERSADTV